MVETVTAAFNDANDALLNATEEQKKAVLAQTDAATLVKAAADAKAKASVEKTAADAAAAAAAIVATTAKTA